MTRLVRRDEVAEVLIALINGRRTREQAAGWATALYLADVDCESGPTRDALNALMGAAEEVWYTDPPPGHDRYLHDTFDFRDWLRELLADTKSDDPASGTW